MEKVCEKHWVQRCRQADGAAYASLVEVYAKRVFAVCLGILGNCHDAEDAVQQTILKGLDGIGSLREGENFNQWLCAIARNVCVDFVRGQNRNRAALQRSVAGQVERRRYPELEEAIARLPQDYRLVLMLYYFDGKDTKSIAEILETTPAAVQTRLCRARGYLRRLLADGV